MPDGQQPQGETPPEPQTTDADGLKSALEKERTRAKEAEKRIKELGDIETRLREYEDRDKSELEKISARYKEADEKVGGLTTENLRLRTALSKSLPLELADRLRGDSAEEMAADADRLLALVAPQRSGPPHGGFDPGARDAAPPDGGDMNRSIRQALGRA